jgi:hypothetical protein
MALPALGFCADPFHDPFHGGSPQRMAPRHCPNRSNNFSDLSPVANRALAFLLTMGHAVMALTWTAAERVNEVVIRWGREPSWAAQ